MSIEHRQSESVGKDKKLNAYYSIVRPQLGPAPGLRKGVWAAPYPNCTDRLVKAPSIHQPVMGKAARGRSSAMAPAATSTGA